MRSPRTLRQMVDAAEKRITRFAPSDAFAAARGGALLIDVRSQLDRERDGVIAGSLHIPRSVLEWRLAPDSPWRSPHVRGVEQQIILVCDHGCSSVLAAATLVDLGFQDAGDVIGGFSGWCDAELPVVAASHVNPGVPGMGPPDAGAP